MNKMNLKHFAPIAIDLTWADFKAALMEKVCEAWREKLSKDVHPVKLWAYASDSEKVTALNHLPTAIQQELWLSLIAYHGDGELVKRVEKMLNALTFDRAAQSAYLAMEACQYAMYLNWEWYQIVVLLPFRSPGGDDLYATPPWGKILGSGRWLINDPLPLMFADIKETYYDEITLESHDGVTAAAETARAVMTKPGLYRLEEVPLLARHFALHDILQADNWFDDNQLIAREQVYSSSGNKTVGVDFGALTKSEMLFTNALLETRNLQHVGSDELEPYVRVFNIGDDAEMTKLKEVVERVQGATIF
jgi:hypothetical protein